MKVFIDECVNRKVLQYLIGHTFVHILNTPLRSTKNGALLRAIASDYDVFLTTDQNIQYQQNLSKFPIAFVIMRAISNDIGDLLPLVPDTLAVLDAIEREGSTPGALYEISLR